MATAVASAPPAPLSQTIGSFERAMITIAVMLATLMQVLDMTIANVALPHMQTSLGATSETVSWVLTSYIVASAIAIPITGWLADKIGRKTLFVWTVIIFTGASALCAIATNLPEMVAFRVLQGISGAFVLPLAQAVMFDINPPERRGDWTDSWPSARRLAHRQLQLALGLSGQCARRRHRDLDADPLPAAHA
jgi:DHA2 family multidrug resistance protein